MDVYEFLNGANDLSGAVVTVFDIGSGNVVYDSTKSDAGEFDLFDLGDFGGYEVASYDLFIDRNGRPCLEVNIEIEDEDE